MQNNNVLYLLDAYALIYRSYYAFINNPRITTSGFNTSATFGFCNFLLEILEQENPNHIAVVFDPDGPTFRHEMYSLYKAQRPPMPEGIRDNIPHIKNIIKALGVACLDAPGYEADDLIGTLAKKAEKKDFKVYMITPDKDYAQLVSENVFMYKPGRSGGKTEVMGIAEVLDHFGIERVEQVIDILGLMGDTADNIPGCVGIGPKTASALISKYGGISEIYEHINEIKGKQRQNLENCKDTVELSRTLATICTEVPTDINVEDLSRKDINFGKIEPIFQELELFYLSKKLHLSIGNEVTINSEFASIETDYIDCTSDITALIDELKSVSKFSFCSFFKSDNNIFSHTPTKLCFSTDKHKVRQITFSENQNNITTLLEKLKPILEDESKTIITDDVKNNIIWLNRYGIELGNHIFDIKIAHYLLHPDMSHDVNRISLEYLNLQTSTKAKDDSQMSLLFEEDDNFDQSLMEIADICFQVYGKLNDELRKTELLPLFLNVEMPLSRVLAEMEIEGVAINTKELDLLAKELKTKIFVIEAKIYELSGENFNISSPKQLGDILFGKLNLDSANKKTKSGQNSTSEAVLTKLVDKHPIINLILEYRGLKKLLNTYAEALPNYINKNTHKIHTNFNQTEAATGRLSSLNPNLQNIPIRTEDGQKIRKAFISGDDDYIFFSADYSQVELRLMAHLSNDTELIDAFKHNLDIHSATASKIYHVNLNDVTEEMRRRAKTANFGIIYGISAWGLSERLQISRKDSKELIDGYFNLYSGVKHYMEMAVDHARKNVFVETIMHRRRYLSDINSRNAVVRGIAERNAVNAPIQGSAADIIKMAMISISKRLKEENMKSKMILQVHDELNFKCHKDEKKKLKELVIDCMENIIKLSVPLTVSCGFGNNWYEAH